MSFVSLYRKGRGSGAVDEVCINIQIIVIIEPSTYYYYYVSYNCFSHLIMTSIVDLANYITIIWLVFCILKLGKLLSY